MGHGDETPSSPEQNRFFRTNGYQRVEPLLGLCFLLHPECVVQLGNFSCVLGVQF